MPCQGVAVMRRKSDAWLNATQILKVAGFDKPQRTRVLEREVQKGTHEKVQGGYGKYQGTWVPMDRGVALARQYGVDRLLQPIFDYIATADSPPLAPKHITAAPARPRKKNDVAADLDAMPTPPPKPQRAAVQKAAAARKAAAAAQRAFVGVDESDGEFSEKRSMSPARSEASDQSETPSPLASDAGDGEYGAGPSKKRKTGHGSAHAQMQQQHHHQLDSVPAHQQLGFGPLRYARMILDYFVSESTQVPQFLVTPPADFDPNVVIDDDGHTALHWACAMGRIRIVKLLLSAGADIFRANSMGQTALMRSVMFTNNYDLRKFPELFELLHRSTINIDRNDRTVFHYIVDIALQKGKTHAARYYIETVLARLVDYPDEVADILNFQDEEGETALTLAARARSKKLVKILLDNGADPKVANRDGKTAEDYILEDERFREQDVTGQRISTNLVPEMATLLETLAASYDAELADKDRELAQADAVLSSLQSEIAESQRTVQQLQQQSTAGGSLDDLERQEQQLAQDLEAKMGKRFRLGWEKWVRDEDQREQQYETDGGPATAPEGPQADLDAYRELIANPPADSAERAAALRARIDEFKQERARLFGVFATKQSESGTGVKLAQYRQLVALGCGVPLDQVDGVIDVLCENLDQRGDGAGYA
ncbi:SPOSA6832_02140, partial [Sporobolomyces salmonicolor]